MVTKDSAIKFSHYSVLLGEILKSIPDQNTELVLDLTGGGGGHSHAIWNSTKRPKNLLILDQDLYAIQYLKQKFEQELHLHSNHLFIEHSKFSQLDTILKKLHFSEKANFILADLGVSSPQLDLAERGFSFRLEGPLDMRMNQKEPTSVTAADVVNTFSENELIKIFYNFGEEPKSKFIAKAICEARNKKKIETTGELSQIIKNAVHYNKASKKNPSTKIFQALRIFVNRELEELETMLHSAYQNLTVGGRLAVISFHSLEDRMVKQFMLEKSKAKFSLEERMNSRLSDRELESMFPPEALIIKPFPISPSDAELEENPRSRSAKLRILERKK